MASAEREDAASPTPGPKKPATSLLPAFEPFSSSPALPRPLKRNRDAFEDRLIYPTPVPTSSTAILSSSPTHATVSKPALGRALSTLTERAPLSAVPSIQLSADSKPVRMGRSSTSCNYQLSSKRLISRVHVTACYKPATSRLERDRVDITCNGWNGIKIHCQGKAYELKKDEVFSSDDRDAEIMIDVHDSRVVVQWPEKAHLGPISSDEEEESSPSKKQRAMLRHSTPPSPSPVQARRRPVSPVSPSPAVQALLPSSPPLPSSRIPADTVEIYEDPEPLDESQHTSATAAPSQATQILSQNLHSSLKSQDTLGSPVIDFSDDDEENDPIIHSFGPFGANLLPRMASITAGGSPRNSTSQKSSKSSHTEPLRPNDSPSQPASFQSDFDVKGHIINQLAFSRLSSTPLSTILSHLPRDAGTLTSRDIREIIHETSCIGEVIREGKDAAGKALESEYYYVPDKDEDDKRKEAVVNDLMKPGLRACRKQHKQYFWRKPK